MVDTGEVESDEAVPRSTIRLCNVRSADSQRSALRTNIFNTWLPPHGLRSHRVVRAIIGLVNGLMN